MIGATREFRILKIYHEGDVHMEDIGTKMGISDF